MTVVNDQDNGWWIRGVNVQVIVEHHSSFRKRCWALHLLLLWWSVVEGIYYVFRGVTISGSLLHEMHHRLVLRYPAVVKQTWCPNVAWELTLTRCTEGCADSPWVSLRKIFLTHHIPRTYIPVVTSFRPSWGKKLCEIWCGVDNFFASWNPDLFPRKIQSLVERWQRCANGKGVYFYWPGIIDFFYVIFTSDTCLDTSELRQPNIFYISLHNFHFCLGFSSKCFESL